MEGVEAHEIWGVHHVHCLESERKEPSATVMDFQDTALWAGRKGQREGIQKKKWNNGIN